MERKDFIRTCGLACLGGLLSVTLAEGCGSTKTITGVIADADLVIPLTAFSFQKGGYRKFIVVQNERLKYPICLYRHDENHYSALLMRCTHQGAELQVFGDRLQCPAHGSEFDNEGVVKNGPAETDLRTFPVTIQNNQINISLK